MDDEFYGVVAGWWYEATRVLQNFLDGESEPLPHAIKDDGHRIARWCNDNGVEGSTDIIELVRVLETHREATTGRQVEPIPMSRLRQVGDRCAIVVERMAEPDASPLKKAKGSLVPRPKAGKHPTDARDRWLYKRLCDVNTPLKSTLSEFRRLAKLRDWGAISTIEGIKRAANRYAERKGIAALPKRTR